MDYEKKYKEALERAKQFSEKPYLEDSKGIVEYIFPELKESEDERIRKSLIDMLKNDEKCYLKEIAWLEKQGEKPTELEPKFKVGDIIRLKDTAAEYTIKSVTDTTYYTDGWSCGIERCEEDYELVEQKSWSEDYERYISYILTNCMHYAEEMGYVEEKNNSIIHQQAKDFLKSIKERYTFKPSNEQMKVCKEVYADILSAKGFDLGTVNSELNRLEEELKKLKDEK